MKKTTSVPAHIGIILDGNGRWAKRRHMPRLFGHEEGAKAIKRTLIAAKKVGIKVVSVFAFSTENWKRPKDEVNGIFEILERYLDSNSAKFIEDGYKLTVMGEVSLLKPSLQNKLIDLIDKTKDNNGLIFNVGLNYGGRAEIVRAVNKIISENINEVSEQIFESFLYTASLPPLDFVIRTSGEQRISNFMLWQIAYSELCFPKFHWPSFNEKKLKKCISEFNKRDRRFGNIKQ